MAPSQPETQSVTSDENTAADDEVPRHHELTLQPLGASAEPKPSTEQPAPAQPVSPNQWFQPPSPAVAPTAVASQISQPLFPSDTPLQSFSQQQEAHNRRHGMMIAAVLIGILILLGGSALAYTVLNARKANDPQAVFNSMLSKSLATKQVHQSVVQSKTGTQVQADYDVSDVAKPRILSTARIGGDSNKIIMKYYSTFQDTFVQYQNTAGGTESYLNKWIQVRDNGVLEKNNEITLATSFEARRIFFGQMIFGNFTSSDKKSLESVFKGGVFTYDKNNVKTETLGGSKVFVYEVKIDTDKLITYNQKVAKVVGVNPDEINKGDLQSVTSAMLYIEAKTQHLLRVTTGDATINYSKYDALTIQPQPASQMSWNSFLTANGVTPTASSTSSTNTTATPGGSGSSTDTTSTEQSPATSDATFDDPNFDDPLWSGDAGEN